MIQIEGTQRSTIEETILSMSITSSNPRYVDTDTDYTSFSDSIDVLTYSARLRGLVPPSGSLGVTVDPDVVFITHMNVDERIRGEGLGGHLFDVFKGIGLWFNADTFSGSVGGGEDTASFFESQGVDKSAIKVEESDGFKSAKFSATRDEIDINEQNYTIVRQ